MDIVEELHRRGGAARFNELAVSRYRLRCLVDRGALLHPDRGCYALPGARPEMVTAARLNATVSCVSALRLYDVGTFGDSSIVHCSVPRHRGTARTLPGVVRHYEDAPRHPGLRLVTLPAEAARAALCLPYDQAVAMLDSACRGARRPDLDEVLAIVARSAPARAAELAQDVDTASRSASETLVRLVLRRAGLRVSAALVIPGVGEVDLLVEGVLIVELDGFAYHSGRQPYRADRRRDRAALRLGFGTVRFAYEGSDPERVLAAVRDSLDAMCARTPGPTSADRSLDSCPVNPILSPAAAVRTSRAAAQTGCVIA